MAMLRVPTPLRPYVGGQSEVKVDGDTVGEALSGLGGRYTALRPHLFAPDGQLRQYVNLFLNDEDIRDLQGLETPLVEADRLMLVPSIAGGN